MKKTFIAAIIIGFASIAWAKIITIQLTQDNDITHVAINDKSITKPELEQLLTKVASLDTNQFIFVVTSSNVPASELASTLGLIQEHGFRKLGLICPGTKGTTNGTWEITLDARKGKIPSCIQGVETDSGFVPGPDQSQTWGSR